MNTAKLDAACDFEPKTAPEAFLQQEIKRFSINLGAGKTERLAEAIAEACQSGASVSDIMAMIDGALDEAPTCNGIDLNDGNYSGCTGTGGDCPECGR